MEMPFSQKEIQYIGYTVLKEGSFTSKDKVNVVKGWSSRNNEHSLDSQATNRFVSKYVHVAKPLYGLIATFN